MDLVIRARRVVTPTGETAASVRVRDGVIAAVEPYDAAPAEAVDLADDEVLLPGLVDTHVHVNEPGRTEWEGFSTATRAAAAGGVTTLLDMPLNSVPPTCTVDDLQIKRKSADGRWYEPLAADCSRNSSTARTSKSARGIRLNSRGAPSYALRRSASCAAMISSRVAK